MRFVSLQSKDVINVYDGKKIGYIADIELDWCQKCIRALIVENMNFLLTNGIHYAINTSNK